MLNVMRSNLKHLKWILGVVAFSMILYLGSYFDRDMIFGGRSGGADKDWAAVVGKQEISAAELQRTLGNIEEGYRQRLQGQFEPLRKALRLPQAALNDLINRTLMIEQARRMGLSISDDELRSAIVSHPAFHSEKGFVGKDVYERVLAANNLSAAAFERSLSEELLLGKWRAAVMGPVTISDAEIEATYRDGAETVSYDYLTIPAGLFPPTEPSDADARAWFARNAERYRKGEGRTALWALIPAATAAPAVSVEEARAFYDGNPSSFERPEQRRVRHILIAGVDDASRAKAEDVLRQLNAGADFAALAQKDSADTGSAAKGGDLGWFGRGRMVAEFDQAVFSATPGETVGPVKTTFGYHIIRVEAAREAGKVPFDDVGGAIIEQLSAPKRSQAVAAKAQELTSVAPAAFEQTARSSGYVVHDTGVIVPGSDVPGLGSSPSVAQAIFQTPVGKVSGPVQVPEGAVVVKVTGTAAPATITFEQVRPAVTADLKREKARDAAERGARAQWAASGGSLDALAGKLRIAVQKAGPVAKGQPLPGLPPTEPPDLLFAAGLGGAPIIAASPDGSVTVASVTAHGMPNTAELAARKDTIRSQIEQQKSNQILSTFIRQIRQGTEIRTNNELLERLNS